jgi:sulfur carrier protein ThiS adenylyltransferase
MKIRLNGKETDIDAKSAFGIRNDRFEREDIIILNGFQLSEDRTLSDGDELFVIRKGAFPDRAELEAMMAARHTPKVHERVKKARVAIAGLGGLGSNIAVALARTGVGNLLLVDFDVVEPSNLNRQSYYIRHLGMPKTEAIAEQIREINPFIHVETRTAKIDESNASDLFRGYHIVCEAFDNPAAKAMLVETLTNELPDVKIVGASGMAGYDSANSIRTRRRLKNFYLCGDLESGARVGMGLMAPRVFICAGHQANMVLRLLMDLQEA